MNSFYYHKNKLYAEDLSVDFVVGVYNTPLYIYSQSMIKYNFAKFAQAFGNHPHLICYAVKANSNLAVLNILASLGAGFDVVSVGEIKRVLAAKGDPAKCVFSGVGKTYPEIDFALKAGIYCFNIESINELELIELVAKKNNKIADISVRVNPNIDANTHPYIATALNTSKFGVDIDQVEHIYQKINSSSNLNALGIGFHIGSQITNKKPFLDALAKIIPLIDKLKRLSINISHIDLGGGIGINYEDDEVISINDYINDIISLVGTKKVILEPGRSIVGNAGIFVTKVEFLKKSHNKNFAIVDGAMNDFLRPSLYKAYHNILPVHKNNNAIISYDIVGPVCESSDYFAKDRNLSIQKGDLISIMDAGAYGFVMSSNYNTRPMVAEVIVKGSKHKLIRKRQTIEDVFDLEENNAID